VVRATIMGGTGSSVVPAVQQYVSLRGLSSRAGVSPASRASRPRTELHWPDVRMGRREARPTMNDLANYVSTAAKGWLDSAIREGNLFRHAVGGNFSPAPAADAAVWMEWLASHSEQPELVER